MNRKNPRPGRKTLIFTETNSLCPCDQVNGEKEDPVYSGSPIVLPSLVDVGCCSAQPPGSPSLFCMVVPQFLHIPLLTHAHDALRKTTLKAVSSNSLKAARTPGSPRADP